MRDERLSPPVLLADIGGTNARFILLCGPEDATPKPIALLTDNYPTPSAAIKAALQKLQGPAPRSAILAVAGRVKTSVVQLTNAAWAISSEKIGTDFALETVVLINDFVPVAASLLELCKHRESDLACLGEANGTAEGIRLALGPGTGFGAAALIPVGDKHLIQGTEAGHVDFGAAGDWDFAVWPFLRRPRGRFDVENVLSGPGILRLYEALSCSRGGAAVYKKPEQVIEAARRGKDQLACEVVRGFARLLGRFSGDLTLIFGATGGVFISGGIAPHMLDFLQKGEFRAAFEQKAPFQADLSLIPTWIITRKNPALVGLKLLAMNPGLFVYESFRWYARS